MAYLPPGGGQSGSDNTEELKSQTELLESIDSELDDQGGTLDSIKSNTGSSASTLTNIKSDTANLAGIKTNTGNTATNTENINAELLAQGVVQDAQKLLQQELKSFTEQSMLNQQIVIKHLEILTSTIIKEEDILC
jgi:hypothetical protein